MSYFTVVARTGDSYETDHVSPVYSEIDRTQQLAFVCQGVLHVLLAVEVLDIRMNTVPYPRKRSCANCKEHLRIQGCTSQFSD